MPGKIMFVAKFISWACNSNRSIRSSYWLNIHPCLTEKLLHRQESRSRQGHTCWKSSNVDWVLEVNFQDFSWYWSGCTVCFLLIQNPPLPMFGVPGEETTKHIIGAKQHCLPRALNSPPPPNYSHCWEDMKIVSCQNIRETYFAILDNIDEQDLGLTGRVFWSIVNYFILFLLFSLFFLLFCFSFLEKSSPGDRN